MPTSHRRSTGRAQRAGKPEGKGNRPRVGLSRAIAVRCAGWALVLVIAGAGMPSHAEEARRAFPDPRIRTIVYQADAVVPIVVHSFRVAMIQFAEDERIWTTLSGDTVGWDVKPVGRENQLSVKPRAVGIRTNLNVVTNRRQYTFELESRPESDRIREAVYRVHFVYPDDLEREMEQKRLRAQEREQVLVSRAVDPRQWNTAYRFAGDRELVPVQMFDDGSSTYFRFDDPRDFPAIFVVERSGNEKRETLANYRVEGEYVVVQRVAQQFSLRQDGRLACLFNDATPAPGVEVAVNAPRETVEPARRGGWRRVVWGWIPGWGSAE
jgi:P-type conjugative transfer protein VirB9